MEVRDPRGLTWTYDYDEAGRLRSETVNSEFFIQPTYDLMAEEDPNTLAELEDLENLILRLPEDARRKALLDQISDQRERWYG